MPGNVLLEPFFSSVAVCFVKFEWSQEFVDGSEIRTHSVDFVNDIVQTDDALFAEMFFNHNVVCDRLDTILSCCSTTLKKQLPNCVEGRKAENYVRSDHFQKSSAFLVQMQKDGAVHAQKSQSRK